MDRSESRPAGRPRDADADDRIIDAAIEEYAVHGRSGYTLNGVARRAGVGKSSIYLRWPDKESLLVDAVHLRTAAPDADTGTLRGDLERIAAWGLDYVLSPVGWVTVRIAIDGAEHRPDTADPLAVGAPHIDALERVWDRARSRGDIAPDAPTATLLSMLYGSLVVSAMLDRERLLALDTTGRRHEVHQLVELALRALDAR